MAIFLSYSRSDTKLPEFQLLVSDLELMRREVWLDQRLTGGQAWWDEILQQIRTCDLFLMVLTRRSLKSEACRRELAYAVDLQRAILPLRLTDLSAWHLPDLLSRAQVADYSQRAGPGDAGVMCAFGLRDAVESLTRTGPPELPDPLPPPPGIPPSYAAALQPLLDAKELSLAKQEEFLQEVKSHLDAEDEDRKSLLEALKVFRERPDIAYRVALEVDGLVEELDRASVPNDDSTARPVGRPVQGTAPMPSGATVRQRSAPLLPGAGDNADGAGLGPPGRIGHEEGRAVAKIARLHAPGVDIAALAGSLQGWYESQNLEARTHRDHGAVVVQCRSKALARRVGAGAALTVSLSTDADEVCVVIGGSQWMDKVAAVGVASLGLFPAAFTAAVGGYKQATLPTKTVDYLRSMIPLHSAGATP